MGLVIGMALKPFISVGKKLELKVRKYWEQNPRFVEVTEERLVREGFFFTFILNRVKWLNKE